MTEKLITTKDLLRHVRENVFDYATLARRALEERHGMTISCTTGCAYCCYAKIVVDAGQGAIIYLFLRGEGRWTPALEARLVEADRAMTAAAHADWIVTHTPCAFLKAEGPGAGLCTVYPVRPIACAMTFSAGNPPGCGVPGGKNLLMLFSDGASQVMADIYSNVMEAAGEQEVQLMTLPGAVLYGRAMVEGLPRPDVHRIVHGAWEARGVRLEDLFDEGTRP